MDISSLNNQLYSASQSGDSRAKPDFSTQTTQYNATQGAKAPPAQSPPVFLPGMMTPETQARVRHRAKQAYELGRDIFGKTNA